MLPLWLCSTPFEKNLCSLWPEILLAPVLHDMSFEIVISFALYLGGALRRTGSEKIKSSSAGLVRSQNKLSKGWGATDVYCSYQENDLQSAFRQCPMDWSAKKLSYSSGPTLFFRTRKHLGLVSRVSDVRHNPVAHEQLRFSRDRRVIRMIWDHTGGLQAIARRSNW